MSESVIENYVIYHAENSDHHAQKGEAGTVNVAYCTRYLVEFNIGCGTNRIKLMH